VKKLIPEEAIATATKLPKDNILVTLLSRVARIDELNELYAKVCESPGMACIEELYKQLDLQIEFDEKQLERIPKTGAFIAVANHPFGALDGLTLLYVLSKARPDIKVMANFLLQNVEPIKDSFISVNPFETRKDAYSNVSGLKAAIQHLENGMPLGIFPAGEVSTYQENLRVVSDKKWENSALKIIRNAKVPVVPICFDGTNSRLFHLLGLINPNLRTLALPSEMLKKKGKVIRMQIGKPIAPKDTEVFSNIEQYGRYLRAKTYAIGSPLEVRRAYFKMFRFPSRCFVFRKRRMK